MSQLDYLAAQSVARVREHDLQTALRRRHPERRASHAVTAAIVPAVAHRRRQHWLHGALAHLHLVHAHPQ